jgi:sortase A
MTARRRAPIRAVLRFVASVMIVSGLLLIADAGITLAWQEPISAFLVQHQQAVLKHELADPPRRVLERRPLKGDSIGKIVLPALHRSYYVVEGTDTADLRKGPGHYHKTPLPGERGTAAIAGHRTTHGAPFRHIDSLRRGTRVVLEMPYGTYVYRVQKTKIVEPTDLSVLRRVGYNRLILSACHPLYSAAQRIVVFARLAGRGPPRVARG